MGRYLLADWCGAQAARRERVYGASALSERRTRSYAIPWEATRVPGSGGLAALFDHLVLADRWSAPRRLLDRMLPRLWARISTERLGPVSGRLLHMPEANAWYAASTGAYPEARNGRSGNGREGLDSEEDSRV